jgi:hypothetical protein
MSQSDPRLTTIHRAFTYCLPIDILVPASTGARESSRMLSGRSASGDQILSLEQDLQDACGTPGSFRFHPVTLTRNPGANKEIG